MTATMFERILPLVTEQNRHFWCGGQDGQLHLQRCSTCAHYIHPPLPACNRCRSRAVEVVAVSGKGTVASFTINYQPWFPGLEVPYVVAIVELAEQANLRLTTNVIHCSALDVRISMPVQVIFEQHEDIWLPLFEPARD